MTSPDDIRRSQLLAALVLLVFCVPIGLVRLFVYDVEGLDRLDSIGSLTIGIASLVCFVLAYRRQNQLAGVWFVITALLGCCSGVLLSTSPAVLVINACGLCTLAIFPAVVLDESYLRHPWGILIGILWMLTAGTRIVWRGPGFEAGAVDVVLLTTGPAAVMAATWYFSTSLRRRISSAVLAAESGRVELELSNEKLERSRARALRALERAQQAAQARSSFVANVSHELRTPLTAIIGYAELIQEELGDEEPPSEDLAHDASLIELHAKQLRALINDLLDLSKIGAGKMQVNTEYFELDALIAEAISTTRPLATGRGNELSTRSPIRGLWIKSDRMMLRQILVNLLSNAAKFTEGGEITLHSYPHGSGGHCLAVQDTGVGIAEDALESIFEAFTQLETSPTQAGTGLGLALVSEMSGLIGAELEVHSTPGQGSTFSVILPARIVRLNDDHITMH